MIYYTDDGNGVTNFRIAVRANSTTWTDALVIRAADNSGGGGGLGNIGIGTSDMKGYKLAVNGSAIFTQAVVKLNSNWPDYVFDEHYPLPPLDSVGNYVRSHHHLPGMPSADSVARTGLNLGAGQEALLKKVEELTLYILEQQQQLKALNQRLEEQDAFLKQQQQRLADLSRGRN